MSDNRRQSLLVLRAQCGDRAAFDELLAGVQVRLHRYLVGLIGDRHAADDVLQETFVIVWKKLSWLREPEMFRPWLHRIATREAFRVLKRGRATPEVPLDVSEVDLQSRAPAAEAPHERVRERLPELVADLTPASRAVVLLHYWEELRLEEVAEVLDLSIGTVKSRLNYGLVALRRTAASIDRRSALEHEQPSHGRASERNPTRDNSARDARRSDP